MENQKVIVINNKDNKPTTYLIHKIPQELYKNLLLNFFKSAHDKLSYQENEDNVIAMFNYIYALSVDGKWIKLSTKKLIEEYCDLNQGVKLEAEIIEYNS